MEIETNMQSREVSIVLPLKDSLPTDAKEREKILDNLAIFNIAMVQRKFYEEK
ncbi:hypothetical protein ACFFHH_15630 [Cytobacillus solani]|uniref:hypothetical protein n=1 Tax=Cytobacillus solani TaxID=1637975 RepID=UPI000A728B9B|nr:hypothetical protein [Cytobacillus solani]USK55291.1 hypothetical protein LIS82_01375 [Cytobacillus solani]